MILGSGKVWVHDRIFVGCDSKNVNVCAFCMLRRFWERRKQSCSTCTCQSDAKTQICSWKIDFPSVFVGLGSSPTLAPGLEDWLSTGFWRTWEFLDPDARDGGLIFHRFLQDLGILLPWRQGWRIDLPSFFGRTWESSDPAARVRRLVLHCFFCRTWESSLKTQTHTHTV